MSESGEFDNNAFREDIHAFFNKGGAEDTARLFKRPYDEEMTQLEFELRGEESHMTKDLSYEPRYDPTENPEEALAELMIRGRHSDGTPIPFKELGQMVDHFQKRMRTSEWTEIFGDMILEENKRQGKM